jgi:redox-sensitive bicupin YhaK (pirin superfamily)
MATTTDRIRVVRAAERPHTDAGWLDSHHSFSFGPHWDPENTGHGLLLVNNDDRVAAGGGFDTHPHRDMEIVTWVLEGELEHQDTTGAHGVITPGLAQRMSAGTGVLHSERNAGDGEVHFIQMWVRPDRQGVEPSYEQRDVSEALAAGGLVAVASGQGHDGAVHLNQRDAVLWAARLHEGDEVTVPDGGHVHLFVARGTVELAVAGTLDEGDAARLEQAGELALTGGPDGAEVLIWVTD